MSLGLPEFGSRGRARVGASWRVLRVLGILALVYVAAASAIEWRTSILETEALQEARNKVAASRKSSDDGRRALLKNADLLIATQSIESSPERVLTDLEAVLPPGVTLTALKLDYQADAPARIDFNVVAATPEAYDRFLSALSKSPSFSDIRPGSESRPGSVHAAVSVNHRPKGAAK
jgi:Tfp pilus assembly protein PilN